MSSPDLPGFWQEEGRSAVYSQVFLLSLSRILHKAGCFTKTIKVRFSLKCNLVERGKPLKSGSL